jgi:hypothetical protein
MSGLDPRIQTGEPPVLDGRVKPGHEGNNCSIAQWRLYTCKINT